MSLWELEARIRGFNRFNSPPKTDAPTGDALDEAIARFADE